MNTYSPVVQWSMVRLMMVLTCTMGLRNQETNFSNAFEQAELKQPVYIQPPAKYSNTCWGENPIIWINKSIYGQDEAPKLWHDKLKKGLKKWVFTPIKVNHACSSPTPLFLCNALMIFFGSTLIRRSWKRFSSHSEMMGIITASKWVWMSQSQNTFELE